MPALEPHTPVAHSDASYTPYDPASGNWTYFIEANRTVAWPACRFRFLSFTSDCMHDDLWDGAGVNQEFALIPVQGARLTSQLVTAPKDYFVKLRCGRYLSYSSSCEDSGIKSTESHAGAGQEFRFVGSTGADVEFSWYIEAVGRRDCSDRWLSFSTGCSDHSVSLGGAPSPFHLHAVRTTSAIQVPKAANSAHSWNNWEKVR